MSSLRRRRISAEALFDPRCTARLVGGFRDPATCDGCRRCVRALADELDAVHLYRLV